VRRSCYTRGERPTVRIYGRYLLFGSVRFGSVPKSDRKSIVVDAQLFCRSVVVDLLSLFSCSVVVVLLKLFSRCVVVVLLHYPELPGLSPSRCAQYGTAVPNEVLAPIYTISEGRGLGFQPRTVVGADRDMGGAYRFPYRGKLVPTSFPGVDGRR